MSVGSAEITITDVHKPTQLRAVEELQMVVWGFEPRSVVPAHVLYTVSTSGGILLGAYAEESLVGFVLGFLGRREGRLYHASHMLGVHPDYRGRGIGAALKWRQRERALEQGLDLMTWTFDPLEARNAHLNLHTLGAYSRTYIEDLYGDLGDRLNRGLPTDRLVAEWELRNPLRLSPLAAPISLLTNDAGKPLLQLDEQADPARVRGHEAASVYSVAIPANIQRLKREDPALSLAWRLAVRSALCWAFARGYVARDFVAGAYILIRNQASLDLPQSAP
jgi:chorismate synthase